MPALEIGGNIVFSKFNANTLNLMTLANTAENGRYRLHIFIVFGK